jgi:hypothetical protein
MTRLAWHLFKRLMRIDVPLSLMAASIASVSQRGVGTPSVLAIVTQIILAFTLVASTAGYVIGLWVYLRLYRDELAIYVVAGHRLRNVALISYIYLIAGLAVLFVLALASRNWMQS